jgi:hypothetical protein
MPHEKNFVRIRRPIAVFRESGLGIREECGDEIEPTP